MPDENTEPSALQQGEHPDDPGQEAEPVAAGEHTEGSADPETVEYNEDEGLQVNYGDDGDTQFNEMAVPSESREDFNEPLPTAEDELEQQIQEMISGLEDEYGADNVTELLVEAAFNEDSGDFLLEAEPRLRETIEQFGKKVRFYLFTDNNGDSYILRSIKPTEWNSSWMRILSGDPGEFDKHHLAVLKKAMVYPRYDETDWDWSGDRMNAPTAMTKQRLTSMVFDKEVTETAEPLEFGADDIENAKHAASNRNKKPGF